MRERDIAAVLDALDGRKLGTVADINGAAPDLAAALHRRFGVRIALIGLDDSGRITPLPLDAREDYVACLAGAGVPPEKIGHLARSGKFDLVLSVRGCGCLLDINVMKGFLEAYLAPGGCVLSELSATPPPCSFLKIEAGGLLHSPTAAAAGLALLVPTGRQFWSVAKDATGGSRNSRAGGNTFFTDRSEDADGIVLHSRGGRMQPGHTETVPRSQPPGGRGRLTRFWRQVMTWAGMQGPGA